MNKPIELAFSNSPAVTPYDGLTLLTSSTIKLPSTVKKAVLRRDQHTCQFCGFASSKYQQVIIGGTNPFDIDKLYTACIFCQLVVQLNQAVLMRSGVLIWMPEISQVDLNHFAREIFIWRVATGIKSKRATLILDKLMQRRVMLREKIGSDDPKQLSDRLVKIEAGQQDKELEKFMHGIRLFPLDRRIVAEQELEFNQFPQILAFWRSKDGPLSGRTEYPGIEILEKLLLTEEELQSIAEQLRNNEKAEEQGTLIYVLAAKLLRDAATFFTTLSEQNITIRDEMIKNAKVFNQLAELLENDPDGSLSNRNSYSDSPNDAYSIFAGRLLKDAAKFFESLARQNEPISEQMTENAQVYLYLGKLVSENPKGRLA